MASRSIIVCAVGLLCGPMTAQSQPVPAGYQQVAGEYGLPPALLYAVALTESGQSSLSHGEFRPWPWALNIDGKGQYFPSRQSAWRALQTALAETDASVDIGLMQVSWRYHKSSLGSSWQALDPYHNMRVAAALLRDCLIEHRTWIESAGCYHAPNNPARANRYVRRVQERWAQVLDATEEVPNDAQ